jgi:transcriptional regulator with XRE-family HTH domain
MFNITKRETRIWELRFKGLRGSDIAQKLGITRQAISKALRNVDAKILHRLNENAGMMGLVTTSINVEKGILLGYHPQMKTRAVLFYLPRSGFQTWFEHEGDCEECIIRNRCNAVLQEAAEFWGVINEEDGTPTKIAEKLFEKVWR